MTTYTNTAEGGTNGTAVSAANSGGGSGDAFATNPVGMTFSSTYKAHGTLGYLVDTTGSAAAFGTYHTITAAAQVSGRLYINLVTLPGAIIPLFCAADTAGKNTCWSLSVDTDNKLRVRGRSGTLLKQFATALTANTWYRIEFETDIGTDTSTGKLNVRYYALDGTTPAETAYTATGLDLRGAAGASYARLHLGDNSATTYAIKAGYDDLKYVTGTMTAVGPVGNSAPTVTAGPAQTVRPGDTVTLTATGGDSDGTVASLTGAITTYPPGVTPPTLTGSATGTGTASASLTQTTTFTEPGTYAWTSTITDDQGATGTDTTVVTVLGLDVHPVSVSDNAGAWTNQGGAASIVDALSDDDDATYAESPDNPTSKAITVHMGETLDTGDITVTVRAAASSGSRSVLIELLQGATVIASTTETLTTTPTDYTLILDSGENAAVTDRTNLNIRLTAS